MDLIKKILLFWFFWCENLPFEETETVSWWLASLSSSMVLLLSDDLDWCLTLRSRGVEGGLPGGSWLEGLDAPARISVIMNLDLWGIVVDASPRSRLLLLLLLLPPLLLWIFIPRPMLLPFRASSPLVSLSSPRAAAAAAAAAPFLSTRPSSPRWWWWCASRLADIRLRFSPLPPLASAMPLSAATWWFGRWWWTVISGLIEPRRPSPPPLRPAASSSPSAANDLLLTGLASVATTPGLVLR